MGDSEVTDTLLDAIEAGSVLLSAILPACEYAGDHDHRCADYEGHEQLRNGL